eukprot:9960080-Karenia_brevis.AAC.1
MGQNCWIKLRSFESKTCECGNYGNGPIAGQQRHTATGGNTNVTIQSCVQCATISRTMSLMEAAIQLDAF